MEVPFDKLNSLAFSKMKFQVCSGFNICYLKEMEDTTAFMNLNFTLPYKHDKNV